MQRKPALRAMPATVSKNGRVGPPQRMRSSDLMTQRSRLCASFESLGPFEGVGTSMA